VSVHGAARANLGERFGTTILRSLEDLQPHLISAAAVA